MKETRAQNTPGRLIALVRELPARANVFAYVQTAKTTHTDVDDTLRLLFAVEREIRFDYDRAEGRVKNTGRERLSGTL